MQTATQQGLVFNSSKCAMCQSQISFHGTIFTAQCMGPDPAKVKLFKTFQPLKIQSNSSHFRLNQLLATISPWPYIQNYLPKGASNKLGLEPLH